MLNDISHLGDWNRICAGLLRLYEAEVLSKFPVVQHLLFGAIMVPPTVSVGGICADVSVGTGTSMPISMDTQRPGPGIMMATARPPPSTMMPGIKTEALRA